ncbi:hypothetical protein CISIN_1g042528mg [Citrus sinensis]|uniref:Uncharacterized protein n=1 Tax=Citrus sinensis TaxID=2711 RepID=A0A067E1T2_CITSI|nr:hypothetical protein CISIN_1g042528mg [Citrus sinensis]
MSASLSAYGGYAKTEQITQSELKYTVFDEAPVEKKSNNSFFIWRLSSLFLVGWQNFSSITFLFINVL